MFVASLPLIYWNVNQQWVIDLLLNKWFLYGLTLLLSYGMVSNIRLMSLKFKDYGLKNNLPKYLLVVISLASVFIFTWMSVPVMILAYVLLSLLFKNKSA